MEKEGKFPFTTYEEEVEKKERDTEALLFGSFVPGIRRGLTSTRPPTSCRQKWHRNTEKKTTETISCEKKKKRVYPVGTCLQTKECEMVEKKKKLFSFIRAKKEDRQKTPKKC